MSYSVIDGLVLKWYALYKSTFYLLNLLTKTRMEHQSSDLRRLR